MRHLVFIFSITSGIYSCSTNQPNNMEYQKSELEPSTFSFEKLAHEKVYSHPIDSSKKQTLTYSLSKNQLGGVLSLKHDKTLTFRLLVSLNDTTNITCNSSKSEISYRDEYYVEEPIIHSSLVCKSNESVDQNDLGKVYAYDLDIDNSVISIDLNTLLCTQVYADGKMFTYQYSYRLKGSNLKVQIID